MALGVKDLPPEVLLDLFAVGAGERPDAAGSLTNLEGAASTSTVTEDPAGSARSTVASPCQRVASMVRS
ncbi:hypothetical protein ACFQX6_00755 [Streptosporangium lutulentum]